MRKSTELDTMFLNQFEELTDEESMSVKGGNWIKFMEGINDALGTIATALEPDY